MAERTIDAIFAKPKRTALRCFIGLHWWSVLSCASGEPYWQRQCLLCGRLEFYAENEHNGLRWERVVSKARQSLKDKADAHG